MAIDYNNISNLRYDSFTGTWYPEYFGDGVVPKEVRTVPSTPPYIITLYEYPQENIPSTTEINIQAGATLTEKAFSVTPGNLEFNVNYSNGIGIGQARFNAAQAGAIVEIKYKGLGTMHAKEVLDSRVPSSGNTTIAGVKTFSDEIIPSAGIQEVNGTNLIKKVVPIGDWDMTASGGTQPAIFAHGLSDISKIRGFSVILRNDAGTVLYPFDGQFSYNSGTIGTTNVTLVNPGGLIFNTADFNATSYNRGWIIITLEA